MGSRDEAEDLLATARHEAERAGDGGELAPILHAQANVPFASGDLRRARLLFETSVDAAHRYGQLGTLSLDFHYLFLVHWHSGHDEDGELAYEEGLAIADRLRLGLARACFTAFRAAILVRRGELDEASEVLDTAQALADRSGHPVAHGMCLSYRAFLMRAGGDTEGAAAAFERTSAIGRAINVPRPS